VFLVVVQETQRHKGHKDTKDTKTGNDFIIFFFLF